MSEQTITCTKCGADLRDKFTPAVVDAYKCCEGGAEIGPVMKHVMVRGGEALAQVSDVPISRKSDDVIFKTVRFPARPDHEADGGGR